MVVRLGTRWSRIGAAASAAVVAAATAAALGTSPAAADGHAGTNRGGDAAGAGGAGLRSALAGPLGQVVSGLDALPRVRNTAWGVNPQTGQVTMTVAEAAPSGAVSRLLRAARRITTDVHVKHVRGALRPQVADGEGISHSGVFSEVICTAGFNVRIHGEAYLITAGHCNQGEPSWDGLGPSVDSTFPGHDYGLIRNTSGSSNGVVALSGGKARAITSAVSVSAGEHVCKSGAATGVTCGKVTGIDQTVTYADGSTVRGLIATDVRADNGDSGSPLFHGNTGLGTLSGGDGHVEYFQPLPAALQAYDATLAPAHPASEPAQRAPRVSPAGGSTEPVDRAPAGLLGTLLGLGSTS
jgi:streptogrisin D